MKDKPILFSTEMVKAILEGRKTQTRRIIKPQPHASDIDAEPNDLFFYLGKICKLKESTGKNKRDSGLLNAYPYEPYQIGQTLWVRETWNYDRVKFIYKASHDVKIQWKPSIFMPKAAARIFLEVTNIRVERLQDISAIDSLNEGAVRYNFYLNQPKWLVIEMFKQLWNSINEKRGYGWDKNPFVWVVEFKVI